MHGLRSGKLVAPRLALVGEAAHVLPPIGAQGLNLGLRDIAYLRDCLRQSGDGPGNAAALRAYEARRRGDIASRSRGVDTLNRSLLIDWLPADFLRGLGLAGLSAVPPLRRAVMRQGIMPAGDLPSLMRATAGLSRP
jgi:2-octaprenyl-6-methoxyphenol hydroxylase